MHAQPNAAFGLRWDRTLTSKQSILSAPAGIEWCDRNLGRENRVAQSHRRSDTLRLRLSALCETDIQIRQSFGYRVHPKVERGRPRFL